MPRTPRYTPAGLVYHVINRANARSTIFRKPPDYTAFEQVLDQAVARTDMRLCAYCIMPNHWHLVLWPRRDGDLSQVMQWLTLTHVRRWHAHRHSGGSGHLYQGRYKSFPVQDDPHFLTVCRYVERNALRAKLVTRAEDWQWCSLWRRLRGNAESKAILSPWPIERPRKWRAMVNQPQTSAEVEALRRSIQRGVPYGGESWLVRTVKRLGLESTTRPRGRPRRSNGNDD
ncbi:MAG: transposase [Planctomycetes bacterium]|nr:transposase [Planctomycetota bacterium]